MEAQVTVAGNVGTTLEWREVGPSGGRAVFSLAHTPRVRRDGEWSDGETTWYRVTCWRRLAEHVRESVRSGQPVIVGGKLTTQRWQTRDGAPRQDFEIEAQWVAHDLRLGTTQFTKMQPRPVADEPQFESDYEAEQRADEQSADRQAALDAPGEPPAARDADGGLAVDADGVIVDEEGPGADDGRASRAA